MRSKIEKMREELEELRQELNEAICQYEDALEYPNYYDVELSKKVMDEALREYEAAKDALELATEWAKWDEEHPAK